MISADNWKPAGNLILEPNALLAATDTDKCLALTAGPGAGKTEMLAQRADFLLQTGTCRYPKRILAISFKVDASANLKERVMHRCGYELASRFDSYTFHAFAKRIIDRFRPVLTDQNALDDDYTIGKPRVHRKQIEYDDLVPLATKILAVSAVARNAVRKTYSDVFLDEFQDCTGDQYRLVQLVFKGTGTRLTAVGDTKQKIMGWAGALDGIFLTFAKDFEATPLNLYRNFRSKPKLMRMQNEIIKVMDPAAAMRGGQIEGDEGNIEVWQFENSLEEADAIAKAINEWLTTDGLPPSEIAILMSKQPDLYAHHLMNALQNQRIVFRNEQQIQDVSIEPVALLIVDYLSCLFGKREPKAWIRLMSKLTPFADEDIQAKFLQNFHQFVDHQRKLFKESSQPSAPYQGWWDFVETFLDKVGTETLSALSHDYESISYMNDVIGKTKARIDNLMEQGDNLINALKQFADNQAVRLLTIHKSKGLEFDTVVMLGVEQETFWGKEEEERCAFFVGASRAKRQLILTSSNCRPRPPSARGRWDEGRTPHPEFLNYATPFSGS